MKKIKYLAVVAALAVVAISCEDYLDRKLDSLYLPEDVFDEYNTMRDFATGIYSFLPTGYNDIDGSMLAAASDEAHHANENSNIHSYATGAWGPTFNPDDKWSHYYTGIRKVNLFLEKSKEFDKVLAKRDTISTPSKRTYLDRWDNIYKLRQEARLLRAFFYFELVKRYGGVPIITKTLGIDDDFSYQRQTADSCYSFIISECLAVADKLPHTWYNYGIPEDKYPAMSGHVIIPPDSVLGIGEAPGISGSAGHRNIGRVTRGTAYALALRSAVYAASKLFNPEEDLTKWYRAANIGKMYFELPPQHRGLLRNNYQNIYTPAYSVAGFTKVEVIFERRWQKSNNFEKANYPIGFELGGANTVSPSQNLVDAFGMASINDVYNPQNPYNRRDPRLDSILVLNGRPFSSGTINNRPVETFVGGRDGLGKFRATTTGYYMRKYVNTGLNLLLGQDSWHSWVLFGLNELYLNYAEALLHATGSPTSTAAGDGTIHSRTALMYVNDLRSKIRISSRLNLYSYPASITKDDFIKALIRERQIELAFEGHRFFDIRRWRLLDDPDERDKILTIRAMKITNESGTLVYDENHIVERRVWDDKMYLYPIPNSEIMKSSGHLVQNPGW